MIATDSSLASLRVFVVEDETLIAMMLEAMLEELGCEVVGVAGTLPHALRQIEAIGSDIDVAILDVNIGGEKIYPVVDALRGVPIMFCTGYGPAGIGEPYRDRIVIEKPYTRAALANALVSLRAKH